MSYPDNEKLALGRWASSKYAEPEALKTKVTEEWWTWGFSKVRWKGVQGRDFYWADEHDLGFEEVTIPNIDPDGLKAPNFTPTEESQYALNLTSRNPETGNDATFAINNTRAMRYGSLTFSIVLPDSKPPAGGIHYGWQLQAFNSGFTLYMDDTKAVIRFNREGRAAQDVDVLTGADYDEIFGRFNQFFLLWSPSKLEAFHKITGGVKDFTKIGEALLTDYPDYIPQNAMPLFFENTYRTEGYTVKLGQIGAGQGLIGRHEEVEDYFADGGVGDWNGASISAGDTTNAVYAGAFDHKPIYFLSDTAGTLSIEIQEPDGTWRTYDTVSVSADTLEEYEPTGDFKYMRLSFDTAATVTAWYSFRMV